MSDSHKGPPLCRVCNRPLSLLDGKEERWYCYKDDELYFAREDLWADAVRPRLFQGQLCVNCNTPAARGSKFCAACGQPLKISIQQVLGAAIGIVIKQPIILLPLFLEALASSLLGWWLFSHPMFAMRGSLSSLEGTLGPLILSVIVEPLMRGTYPTMVRNAMNSRRVGLIDAFRAAARKYPSLMISGILILLATVAGAFLLVVPGLIVATWYFYTDSAIILEDRGALNGMSASKRFGHHRKMDTFILFLIISVPSLVSSVFLAWGSPDPYFVLYTLPGIAIVALVGIIVGALRAIASAFTYITYGMPKGAMTQALPLPTIGERVNSVHPSGP